MLHPGELISRAGEALIAGRLDAMVQAYSYPCVIAMDSVQHIMREPQEIIEVLAVFREDLLRQGVVSARTNLDSQVIFNEDMAFLNVHAVFYDAEGGEVTDSRTSYVMRQNLEHWEIITVSVDKKANYTPGACLLENEAA